MAGEPLGSESRIISNINVTPFVDVVLVLLVIFMVTAPVLVKDIMGIQLPKASHGEQKPAAQSFGVAITAQGQILLNGQISDEAALVASVKEAFTHDPKTQVLISADANSKHADLVRVIDLVKGTGVTRFALQIHRQD